MLDWYQSTYPEWNPIWLELFENAETPFIPRPIYCIPFDQTWEAQSNLTMIGDAAHVMPFAGEGVNMAMLDALELSECLTSDQYKTLQEAIFGYETQMRKRLLLWQKNLLTMENGCMQKNALENMLNFSTDLMNNKKKRHKPFLFMYIIFILILDNDIKLIIKG
jgi:flavin-dependent dehydrogenase